MTTQPQLPPAAGLEFTKLATFDRMRVLAWSGSTLYASRNYELLAAEPGRSLEWRPVATFHPAWWRNISARGRLAHRLLRDGFHALAALHSGDLVAAVPGAIVSLRPGEREFRVTHTITRGNRPLHIAATPEGQLFWGEYFDNRERGEVFLYASTDRGQTWDVAYVFPKKAIRHIHNVVFDSWENCLWILTGDYGDECRILRASADMRTVEPVLQGNQQARAVVLLPTKDGLYFASDTPLEANYIYCLDRRGVPSRVAQVNASAIYGCVVDSSLFVSTMVEPSDANPSREARLYGSADGSTWEACFTWRKDVWPMGLFQYGNVFLPDGENQTDVLAATTIAVSGADLQTHLWHVKRRSRQVS